MSDVSEYDERQIRLMKESLKWFEKKQICFGALAHDLESAFCALEEVDKEWRRRFWKEFAPLFMINEMESVRNSEDGGMLGVQTETEKKNDEKAIQKAFVNLKKLVKCKLREAESMRMKKLDERSMKKLSFPGFKVEEMEFSPVERTLEVYMEGAWLEEEGGQVLGQGLLIFSSWESLVVSRWSVATKTWSRIDDAHPESLKSIEEYTFSNTSICLRGLGEKTGELLEWKMVGAQVDAEFEPEFQPNTPYRRQKVPIKVSLNAIEEMFDSLITGRLSREEVASWASQRLFADDEGYLEYEPSSKEKEISRGISYLIGVDLPNIDDSYLHSIEDFIEFRDSHFGKK